MRYNKEHYLTYTPVAPIRPLLTSIYVQVT